jgi:hypothetical protein
MNIISCGPTGSTWDGSGPSIGVNDCEKFGRKVDALVVVNSDFEIPRLQIIKKTLAPAGFYSQLTYWQDQPNYRPLPRMKRFTGRENKLETGWIYSSRTSPFVAITLAALWGHKEIVLYGVDFDDHPVVRDERLIREVDQYKRLSEFLHIRGISLFLSTDYGALAGFIPIKK